MIKLCLCVVALFSVCNWSFAKITPKFIKPCSVSSPKFEECAIENGYYAIPFIIKGDKDYSIPKFEPLRIDKLNYNAGSLNITFDNMEITGLDKTKILAIKYNAEKETMFVSITVPKIEIKSHYRTRGRILVLPIEGEGPSYISLLNGVFNCTVYMENFRIDSKRPMVYKSSEIAYSGENSEYNFENLFNGNKQLGDQVNKVLNENHKSLYHDFGPVTAETVNTVMKTIITGIVQDLYFKDAFHE